jgi:hypothetical protein
MKSPFVLFYALLFWVALPTVKASEGNTPTSSEASFVLRGRVLDAATGTPLSYATLSIHSLGLGTASNMDGYFTLQLPAKARQSVLNVTFMGYTPKNLAVADLSGDLTIALQPKSYQMADVVITQKDFCKEFLKKAWQAIPDNYPIEPTRCEGFYRETERLKDSTFLYFSEAVLDVYKNTYKNALNFGQIRVVKSRKNVFPGIDSINDVRFYGGPHFPNDLDIVFSRWDFIKPSEYSHWQIELSGSYRDSLSTIYVLTFRNRDTPNSSFQGKMYIDRDTYAFVGFDFWRAGYSNFSDAELPSSMEYVPGLTSIKIGYTEWKGKYHLGFINYKTSGINTSSRKRIYKDIEYVTTSIRTDSVAPIPYADQFDYTDILSIEAQPYDSSYWKDYNVLDQSQIMNKQATLSYQKEEALKQLTMVYNKELTSQEKVLLFLKRFTFDGGFSFLPARYKGGVHSLTLEGNALGSTSVSTTAFGISTTDGARFELNKQWSVFGTVSTALYGIEQLEGDLGLTHRSSVSPSGRWFFLDLGAGLYAAQTRLKLGTINNPYASVSLQGKPFDAQKLTLKAGENALGVKPVLGLAVRMGKQYELFTEGSWLVPLFHSSFLQVKEADGNLFTRKHVRYDWDDARMNLNVNGNTVQKARFELAPWSVRIGIRSGF